ncbi:hypothetical protein H2201_007650 [Coniosporium apollinis]|uniref:SET domain-containing protein n=1 Tax=Coniosporium apollinis TaxID=61459 RepID=A0ABQ9NJ06_9PEZI|nr:hypothetical protein H2201_007650 [Coniosporium apollinis]
MGIWEEAQEEYNRLLALHKKLEVMKGRVPPQQPTLKENVLTELSSIRCRNAQRPPGSYTCHTVVTNHYPPCLESWTTLQKTSISQLRIGIHHVGQVLIVRLITKPANYGGCLSVIEDEHSNVAIIEVHNDHREPYEVLPEGATCAIKQPFLYAVSRKKVRVRVDHPSDLVLIAREPTRALARLSETYYASCGIEEVAQNTSKTRQEWLNHASNHETVVIKDSGAAGRGLFATKSVNKGDVVLCETAFAMVLPPSQLARVMCRHDLVRKRFRVNPDVLLYVRVMEELQRRPTAVPDLLQLWCGDYRSEVKEVLIMDGNLVLDAFHISRIVELNAMACGPNRLGEGIWLKASYTNHSCAPNVSYKLHGNFLVAYALEDIGEGQELFVSYVDHPETKPFEERHRALADEENAREVTHSDVQRIDDGGNQGL